jgi:hypothetical protein
MKLDRDEIEIAAATLAAAGRVRSSGDFADRLALAIESANEEANLSPAWVAAVRE